MNHEAGYAGKRLKNPVKKQKKGTTTQVSIDKAQNVTLRNNDLPFVPSPLLFDSGNECRSVYSSA
jgi:hypothetical protein